MNWRRAKPPADFPSTPSDYVELFSAALAGRVVRRPPQPGLRVRILGPLEARLTESDRVVLGGLVEGTWPPESNTDAWLSRPMRLALGLDLPERRIGLSGARFRPIARRARSDLEPCRQDRRRADGAVALRPATRRHRRRAMARRHQARRDLSRLGARARPAGTGRCRRRSPRRSRRARRGREAFRSPRSSIGCAIPTRSMPSTFCACAARCGRYRAWRRRARHHHSRRRRRISRRISRPAFPPIRCAN